MKDGRRGAGRGSALTVVPGSPTASTSDEPERQFHGAWWHASTWDLQQGLVVREGLPLDAMDVEVLTAYLCTQGVMK